MSMTKDLKKLMAEYKAKGWRIESTRKNHTQWFAPDKKTIVTASGTPGDPVAYHKHLALLRKGEKAMAQNLEKV